MIETTVGQLSTREIGTFPPPSHLIRGTSPRTSAEALGRPFGEYGGSGDKEDLTSEPDVVEDEVGDLSGESSERADCEINGHPSFSRSFCP
jgi:hypothetical protein